MLVCSDIVFQLKQYDDACEALDEAVSSLKNAKNLDRKKKERFLKDISEGRAKVTAAKQQAAGEERVEASKTTDPEQDKEDILTVSKPSEQFPAANKAISVRFQKGRGRYVVANEDIPVGTTLVVEQPVTWACTQRGLCSCMSRVELLTICPLGLAATANIA